MPATLHSLTRRSWRVRLARSLRPRACGVLGGVVHHRDEREPLHGHQGQPAMATAIQVQQYPEARARLAAAAMAAARVPFGHQPCGLQRRLDKRITEPDSMLAPRDLMEVPHIEALVPLAVEG